MQLELRASFPRLLGLLSILAAGATPVAAQCETPPTNQVLQTPSGYWQSALGRILDIEDGTALVGQHPLVHVFERDGGGAWASTQVITLPFPAFNGSLDLDGDRFVVGDHAVASNAGSAAVYERDGSGTWSLVTLLAPSSSAAGHLFGRSVALWGDRIAVGAAGERAVYLFERDAGGAWSEVERIPSPVMTLGDDGFGTSVALQADRLVVGAHLDEEKNPGAGAVHVYQRDGAGAWQPTAKLFAANPAANKLFGFSTSLDGDRLAVGHGANGFPGVEVFAADASGAWSLEDLVSGGIPPDFFGLWVALDGQDLAVGAHNEDLSWQVVGIGAVYVFQRQSQGDWVQTAHLNAPQPGENFNFGFRVALDGQDLLVAEPDAAPLASQSGAFVFRLPVGVTAYCTAKQNSQGCAPPMSWTGGTSLSSGAHLRLRATDVINQSVGLLFYSEVGEPTPTPFQGGFLCLEPPVRRTSGQLSGGNVAPPDCSGSFSFDFTQYVLDGVDPGLGAGTVVWAQYWYRDPASASTTGLTDAVRFAVCP